MSELKATSSGEIRARDALLGYWWYEKSEADAVIAELKDKLRHYPMFIAMLESDKLEIAKDKIKIRHQKYKRCLAMARWCNYWANYWECCQPFDCGMFIARAKFFRKWHKRWRELAEKFKEAK